MKKIFLYLTYAGTIPFIFCAIFLSADIQQLPLLGSVEKILSVYGLVISSFLAGAHWGQHLHIQGFWSRALPILSNIILILLWFGFLMGSFKMLMAMFVVTFFVLLVIDYRLFQINLITHHYFQARLLATVLVIISLALSEIVS